LVAGHFERAGTIGVELEQARKRHLRIRHRLDAFHRNAPAGGVERIGAVPSDERCALRSPTALPHLDAVDADAIAFEAQRSGCRLERLAIRDAVVDRQCSESERALIWTVDLILPRDHPLHVVIVDVEGAFEVGSRPAGHANTTVDLLAFVASWEAE
jgi:hypothetical protein